MMSRLRAAVNETDFEINSFRVGKTGAGGDIIELDIRRHEG